ncbi:MAG: hypothetical protein GY953_57460, partial [bacterium]|nr:hypothetical protein [bacterium]
KVPAGVGYSDDMEGGRSIGQAWGKITYEPEPGAGNSAPIDFYSPYVLVDGTLEGKLALGAKVEMRTLQSKPRNARQPDVWSEWQMLATSPGGFSVPLGRERFNGKDVSIHGVYRFQLRAAGASTLKLTAFFENGIMSIPQIFDGSNTIRFKVKDSAQVDGPIQVTYRYQTASGEKRHEKALKPSDFVN